MKIKFILPFILVLGNSFSFGQNIGINEDGSSPDVSAILDIKANDKGILVPRLNSTQMAGVSNPADGLLIYNTSTDSFWFFAGGSWGELNADGDSNPVNELQTISKTGNVITLSNGGGSIIDDDQDNDPSPSNELQSISKSGNYIVLSNGGGSVLDNSQDNDWIISGSNVYRFGNVGIGTGPSAHRLNVSGSSYFSGSIIGTSDIRGSIFYDIQNTGYYLDPASSSTSLRALGTIYGSRYYDISASSAYYLDFSDFATSLRTPGAHYAQSYRDISGSSGFYLDPSNTGTSLWTPGTHIGNRFSDYTNNAYYLDPASTAYSLYAAGTLFAQGLQVTSGTMGAFQLSTGAVNGHILQSDGAGNASWVDPNSIGVGGSIQHMVVHNEATSGTFWTHPSVNVTVAYNPTTRTISVTNNAGQSYWDVSIFANSGAGNSTSCQDLNSVGFINNGATISLAVTSCTTTNQGFSIMAADETGSTTGFKMDIVIYQDDLNAYVSYW